MKCGNIFTKLSWTRLLQICLKADSEYHICSKESFQQEVITSQEGIVEMGKSKLFVRGGSTPGVIMVIGDFKFSCHTPCTHLLTGVKLIMEILR